MGLFRFLHRLNRPASQREFCGCRADEDAVKRTLLLCGIYPLRILASTGLHPSFTLSLSHSPCYQKPKFFPFTLWNCLAAMLPTFS